MQWQEVCTFMQQMRRLTEPKNMSALPNLEEVIGDADGLGDVGQHHLPGLLHHLLHLGSGCHVGGSGRKVVARQGVAVDLQWWHIAGSIYMGC